MRPHELTQQITTRAFPLPEELRAEQGGEDRLAAATEILRDSEERTDAASRGCSPAAAARENRPSEETAES